MANWLLNTITLRLKSRGILKGRRINYSKKKTPGGKHVSRGKANVLDEANLKALCKPNQELDRITDTRKNRHPKNGNARSQKNNCIKMLSVRRCTDLEPNLWKSTKG
jgi:hypothetical protein